MAKPKSPPPPQLPPTPSDGIVIHEGRPRSKVCAICEWWDPSINPATAKISGECHLMPETRAKNAESWCSFWVNKFK
jgi:hypothetical protein